MTRSERHKKSKWKKIISSLAALLLVGVGVYAFSIYQSMNSALNAIHDPIGREELNNKLSKKEPFSVLLLGVDERKGDRGRSDTMIVMTVNPENKSVKMVSIPRDTRTEIVGRGKEDKINHAYAYGGPEMSIATVEKFLDMPIDYYMQMNMNGFKDIVDAVGGVTVQNDLDFTYNGTHFAKGEIKLDGQAALNYTRMRKKDPRGDFGRQQRQRQIIEGVMKEGASLSSLTNYDDIFKVLGKNVKTNMTFSEMIDIQKNYKDATQTVEQIAVKGSGTKINGVYYILVSDAERQRVAGLLKG
ncbi:LytR family transcriptional regulator [Peribacillus alkalitolerans]|uniref:polyisoprenyl-teichoic acid--peptidoglycan teichoic acid transferase TagU n=1 Tax=Peribacillus alkalitolerans TaxID=1550385 RepID=UPI0013D4639D|nr:LytR family transcriptional regulator [Peribacillus alkalitolerans]